MRTPSLAASCAALLLATSISAQNSGPASNGDFKITMNGMTGSIQYNANGKGSSAKGEMTLIGRSEISNGGTDSPGAGPSSPSEFTLVVNFDCLRIDGSQAAMSGVIASSNVPENIGARALLAVQDGGEGVRAEADKFTWGVYRASNNTWVPVDAEDPKDYGASLRWHATDAERLDDKGIPSHRSTVVDCNTFSFGSYAFEALPHGAGQIQVKP